MHTKERYGSHPCQKGARVPVDQNMAARLRDAREQAGFGTAADAMRAFDWPGVYNQHENGTRGFSKHAGKYASAYRVREEWLRYGVGLRKANVRTLVVSGEVGRFGVILERETATMPRDTTVLVEEPPGEAAEYVAYRVTDDANYPALFAGDILYAGKPADPVTTLGRQCVATLADGSKRVCILARGTAVGLFMVLSINAAPVPDVEVIEASPIVWIKRG